MPENEMLSPEELVRQAAYDEVHPWVLVERRTRPAVVSSPEFKQEAVRRGWPEQGSPDYWEVVKRKRRPGAQYGPA
jgi:hypothetical protein